MADEALADLVEGCQAAQEGRLKIEMEMANLNLFVPIKVGE